MKFFLRLLFIVGIFSFVFLQTKNIVFARESTAKCIWSESTKICDIDVRDEITDPGCISKEEELDRNDCRSKSTKESCTANFLECHIVPKSVTCSGSYPHLSKDGSQCCKTCSANACSNCVIPSINTGAKCTSSKYYNFELKDGKCVRISTSKTPVFMCLGDATCQTAIGDIKTKPDEFIGSILKFALPLAAFILLLGIIYVGYLVLTSQGNPEKLKLAKEIAVSIITGFIMLIFSFAILNSIGQGFLGINATPSNVSSQRND